MLAYRTAAASTAVVLALAVTGTAFATGNSAHVKASLSEVSQTIH